MAQNVRRIPTEVLDADASLSEAQKVSISEKSVQASICFSSLSHEASEGDNVFLSGHLALLINLKSKRDISKQEGKARAESISAGKLTSAISIWTEAWSFDVISLLVAVHFLGM